MKKKYLNKDLLEKFRLAIPYAELIGEEDPAVLVAGDRIVDVLRFLQGDPVLRFDMLSNLTAVDYPEYFEMVYHLYSRLANHTVTVKARLAKDHPVISSVTELWPSANFQEREVYDLMGITFENHPNLARILLPEDFVGHPLRKDFKPEARCATCR